MNPDSNQAVFFQCHLCGECCSSWNIPIESHKAEQLLEKPWVRERLADNRREIRLVTDGMHRIPLTDENVCVFLGEDRRCLIEVNEGLALKPHECKRFPFATVKMPNGETIHDTSAACKTIAEKLLLAFQPILLQPKAGDSQELSGFSQETEAWLEDTGLFPAAVRLSLTRSIRWEAYMDLQAQWKPWFASDTLDAASALKQVQQSLNGPPLTKKLSRSRAQLTGLWPHMVTIGFLRKPYRTLSWLGLLRGQRYHDPRLFGEPLALQSLYGVQWPPEREARLKSFLFNVLCRKRLLASGGTAQSLLSMALVACLLVRWYAYALASLQAEALVSDQDVVTAIRLVERYYTGHQPRFFAWFQSGWRGWLLQKTLLG